LRHNICHSSSRVNLGSLVGQTSEPVNQMFRVVL
jgi:hypothetical protein